MSSNDCLEQKKNTYLYFKVGNNEYAVHTDNVLEIMKLPELEYPQKLPNNIVGLLKYNNFVINIIDLRFYIDAEVQPYSVNNELLIIRTDEIMFGIIIDKILGITTFEATQIDIIPFVDNKTIVESLYKYNQDTIFIINVYAIENLLKQHDVENSNINMKSLMPQDEISRNIMKNRTQAIADKSALKFVSGEFKAKNNYISFNLSDNFYCIELSFVKEVLKDTTITHIPGVPNFIEGIMNLRGDYITVLNLKQFLNLSSGIQSDKNPVIIVNCNDLKLAFLIDKINELFEFQENDTEETLEGYYLQELIYNGTLYTVLNVDKITSDKRIFVTDM